MSWLTQLSDLGKSAMRLRPHLRGGRYLLGAVIFTSLCSALLEGLGVAMLVPLLNLLAESEKPMRPILLLQEWLPGHATSFYVVTFCGLVLGAIIGKNILLYLSQFLAARLKRRISVNLRDALYRRLLGADIALFEQRTGGEMANVFLLETQRTLNTVDSLLLILQRGSMALFYVLGLLFISLPLTLITVGLGAVIGVVLMLLSRKLRRSGQELAAANQQVGARLIETFAGIRLIRGTHSGEREVERFRKLVEHQGKVDEQGIRLGALFHPLAEVIAVGGAIGIVALAYFLFVRPQVMLSSHLLGFGFILLRLLPLLNQMYSLQGHVIYMVGGVKEVERWLDSPQHPHRPYGDEIFSGVRESIRFETVSYTYPNGTEALKEVSFELPAGRMLALVGASGSGKSTIASLLLRFRQVTTGCIRVDGRDCWDFTAESWHQSIAIVEQEAFVFHDTLRANIAYGCPHASAEDISAAVRLANLEDVVSSLPAGLDTVVGERGSMLSGGQRQRLAIARAIVRQPRVLILDEATSALDSISEQLVQSALNEASKGRTVLVIAHRLSTIKHADEIVVLEQGRVVERGTWEELLALRGTFYSQYEASLKANTTILK